MRDYRVIKFWAFGSTNGEVSLRFEYQKLFGPCDILMQCEGDDGVGPQSGFTTTRP